MRSLALVLPATLIFIVGVHGQALTEHAAAAAGAAIGVGAGKGLSNSMTKIFGETDKETAKAAKPDAKKPSKPVTDPAPDPLAAKSKPSPVSSGDVGPAPFQPSASHASSQPRHVARKPVLTGETTSALQSAVIANPIPAAAPAAPPIVEPIIKVPTMEDLANIKAGTTEEDMVTALGQPSSRITIPDDDGHLREICQYWANGRVLGTIRLDNGQVATVEPSSQD
jgi:hypothetical protein